MKDELESEFDCSECERHIIHFGPRGFLKLCATCTFLPGWHTDPILSRQLDPMKAQEQMEKDRGTGRTTAMVKKFPTKGPFIVLVHHHAMIDYIKHLSVFTKSMEQRAKFYTLDDFLRTQPWRGVTWPIHVDHAVWEGSPIAGVCELRWILNEREKSRG